MLLFHHINDGMSLCSSTFINLTFFGSEPAYFPVLSDTLMGCIQVFSVDI